MILSVLKGLLTLANALASYLSNKQLLDAGADQEALKHTQEVLKNVKKAKDAVGRVKSDPSLAQRLRDKYGIK